MALVSGTVVDDRYTLDHPLGEGGMGTVWAATHQITGGRVALKFVRHDTDPNGEHNRRFLREARSAAQVEHPNVVGVRDVLTHEGMPVIVMDLLQGETLAARIAREGPLPLADVVAIGLPVLSAAGAAHAAGLIHRDLKPDNIFLSQTPTGEVVRVLDFGVAKSVRIEELPVSAITESGAVVGTPAYMAPEQLLGEKNLDHRVDVWAIGAILYESLVGKRPVDGENYGQLVKGVLSGVVPRADLARPDLPADVVELLARMLHRERDERLSDLKEAADVLARHGTMARPSFGASVPPPPTAERSARSKSSSGNARVVVDRSDPGAPTIQHTPHPHVPSGALLAPPVTATEAAVARTDPAVTTPSRWRSVALLASAAAVVVVVVRWTRTSERAPVTAPTPGATAAAPPPTSAPLVSTSSPVVASTTPSPSPSLTLLVAPSVVAAPPPSKPVVLGPPGQASTVASAPASTVPPPAASPSPPVASTAPPNPSGGLVTKPPF